MVLDAPLSFFPTFAFTKRRRDRYTMAQRSSSSSFSFPQPGGRSDRSRPSTSASFRIPGITAASLGRLGSSRLNSGQGSPLDFSSRLSTPSRPTSSLYSRESDPITSQTSRAVFSSSQRRTGNISSRPLTQSNQANTTRPFTASSYHHTRATTADGFMGNYVSAVLENRAVGREVGIASIEHNTGMFLT